MYPTFHLYLLLIPLILVLKLPKKYAVDRETAIFYPYFFQNLIFSVLALSLNYSLHPLVHTPN
jgi:hydrogenase-4 membrane subunit HyfE